MARAVLLIEDDDAIRTPLAGLLRSEGFQVTSAKHGKEALELLKTGALPGLILLDLMMPEMSGGEFLEAVRRRQDLRTIPIVIMTAWLHRWADVTANADDVLTKPIDTDRMLELVRRYCGGDGPEPKGRRQSDKPSPDSPTVRRRPGGQLRRRLISSAVMRAHVARRA